MDRLRHDRPVQPQRRREQKMTLTPQQPAIVLVPGAWMGDWIWDDVAVRLRALGDRVSTLTLPGLHAGTSPEDAAAVTLADHVSALREHVEALDVDSVLLVGHSYSGMVVGQVADQLPDLVRHSVHIGSFLPRDGRSLIDDWGENEQARAAERSDIVADGMLWAPPPPAALQLDPALDARQRAWLLERFVPHPGRTVLDPAQLERPITDQRGTYVTDAPMDGDLPAGLPPELSTAGSAWTVKRLGSGHWPMLTNRAELTQLLHDESMATVRGVRSG